MKKFFVFACFVVCLANVAFAGDATGSIVLGTTTSVEATGLLDVLLPAFEKATGIAVKPVAVGTGKAFNLARNGDADVVLAHARKLEDQFVADGFGTNAWDLMFNDFVILGPVDDPAKVKAAKDVSAALKAIANSGAAFASRGDNSGTHIFELALWEAATCKPASAAYLEVGQGMNETLLVAFEKKAYTLCDRSTWLSMRKKLQMALVFENPEALQNPYGVMAVSNAKLPKVKTDLANRFVEWIVSPESQQIIGSYTIDGETLFHLSVKKR